MVARDGHGERNRANTNPTSRMVERRRGGGKQYVSPLFTDLAGAQMRVIARVDAVWFPVGLFDS